MTHSSEGLNRVIGVSGVAFTVINLTIGAGIFVLPATVSLQLGAFGIFCYLFCTLMMTAIVLCYVEIGSRFTVSGGSYTYVETAFGKLAGFIINWLYFFGWGVLGSAAVLNIIADSISVLFPAFTFPVYRGLLFLGFLGIMMYVNIRGAKDSVLFLKFITIIKLLPLIAIIIFGFSHINGQNLHWQHLPSMKTFGNTALILFFAFAGFETSLNVSGEIKNPARTIPRGILLGGASVLVIYLFLQIIVQGVLGPNMAEFKDAPLAAVANSIIGPIGATILVIATAISCFGNISCDILSTPRLLFAGANDGLFPKYLSKVHPKFKTPYSAIITYGTLIFIFSISGGFKQLAVLASASVLLIYLGVLLAMIKMRTRKAFASIKGFTVPGGLIVPVIGILSIIWLLSSLSKPEILSTIIFIGIVCILYFIMQKFFVSKKNTNDE
jgi:amino acid transporter